MSIDLKNLNCNDCPAFKKFLKNKNNYGPCKNLSWRCWIKYCEKLRERELEQLKNKVEKVILCESIPAERFIYDPKSIYCEYVLKFQSKALLRCKLAQALLDFNPELCCKEGINCYNDLIEKLRKHKIIILDCALCPLHRIKDKDRKDKRIKRIKSAKTCFENNVYRSYLDTLQNQNVEIIAIFSNDRRRCQE